MKRFIITGPSACGKSSTIRVLESKGHEVKYSISRNVIDRIRSEKGEDWHPGISKKSRELMEEELVKAKVKQYNNSNGKGYSIYERGIQDSAAFLKRSNIPISNELDNLFTRYKYDHVFVLEPWNKIFEKDNYRTDNDLETSQEMYESLVEVYTKYGSKVTTIPINTTPEKRAEIIIDIINSELTEMDIYQEQAESCS